MSFLTRLIRKTHFWRLSALFAADALVFGVTDPNETASFMLIVGFLLMSATAYYLFDGVLAFAGLYGFPARHRKRVLRASALLASGLLALESIGQLSARDILILGPLTGLAYFYLAYPARRAPSRAAPPQAP